MTIHKLLQIKRNIDSTGQENFISLIDENNIKPSENSIFYYDLIIVDEVSMLNKDLTLKLLLLQKKIKGKIIFLGDKAQLPPVNEVDKAKRIIEELEKAAKEGKGAAQLDGRMIDAASARMAENIVNINKLIEGK